MPISVKEMIDVMGLKTGKGTSGRDRRSAALKDDIIVQVSDVIVAGLVTSY